MSLAAAFREKVSSMKDFRMKNETEYDVAYPTGFLAFDFMNGTVIHVKSDTMDFTYNSIGIVDGSMVTVIGRSGCGKTTFIMQSASEIVRPHKTSTIFHDDIEGGIVNSRKQRLMRFKDAEMKDRYIARNSGVTAENFYQRIKMIHDMKIEDRASYEYDTGLFTADGERIFKLEPTVYILDSIAMLMPEKLTEEEELSGQMSATAAAKTNSAIFKRIIPMLKAANIILFVVNHITEKIEINMFAKTKAQIAGLKQGESLGGGRVANYLTNLLIRLDDNSTLKETEGFYINGSIVEVSLIKSRTSARGRSINLVFNHAEGFDRELSLFYMLKDQGMVTVTGTSMTFMGEEKVKCAQKELKEKLRNDPEFRQVFMKYVMIGLDKLINDAPELEEETDIDLTSNILNMYPGSTVNHSLSA